MGIHIARPRVMLAILAVLAATAATLTFVVADERPPQYVIVPMGPTNAEPPVVDDAERTAAEDSVRRSERVKAVLGGVSWTTTIPSPATRRVLGGGDEEIGAGFNLVLSAPLSSSGPWLLVRCSGTHQLELSYPFREIRTVSVIVSHTGEVLEFHPDDAEPGDPQKDSVRPGPVFTDLTTGGEVWRGQPGQQPAAGGDRLICPKGLNDD